MANDFSNCVPYGYGPSDFKRLNVLADVVELPNQVLPEFNYIVCTVEDGILCFHSGHYTFENADNVALLINGVVLQLTTTEGPLTEGIDHV